VDIPLWDALEAADGRESAAVTNSGDDKLFEHRSIREPIDPLREVVANPRRDIIAPSNDDVGAKRGYQCFVFLGSIGDDRQPLGFGELVSSVAGSTFVLGIGVSLDKSSRALAAPTDGSAPGVGNICTLRIHCERETS
jgi:hypothetical protein